MLDSAEDSNSEKTYAAIAFKPKTSSTVDHHACLPVSPSPFRRKSTIHIDNASSKRLSPPANRTYELVQSFLLIGNQRFHTPPAITPLIPAISIPRAFSAIERPVRSHIPVSIPIKAVPSAGSVLINPSGSRTFSYK